MTLLAKAVRNACVNLKKRFCWLNAETVLHIFQRRPVGQLGVFAKRILAIGPYV